jgi:ankyrin repeat protein
MRNFMNTANRNQRLLAALLSLGLGVVPLSAAAQSPVEFIEGLFGQGKPAGRRANFTPPSPVRFGIELEAGNLPLARQWLESGLSPDYQADKIGSGLMIGAWEGNIPMMQLFYEHGANIQLENRAGEQALLLAAWQGHQKAMDWLIAHGAQVNRKPGRWTALHYAAFSGHAALAEDLLARGADIDARSPNGATPLMMAIYDGHPDLAEELLKRGANPRIQSDTGEDAFAWAMRHNQLRLAREMVSPEEFARAAARPKEYWGQSRASRRESPEIQQLLAARRMLVAKGMPVEAIDRNIAALRARQARAEMAQEGDAPPRAAVLEITAEKKAPGKQKARVIRLPREASQPR